MQIVIDIDEKIYHMIEAMDWKNTLGHDKIWEAVHNGTLLPKGHGRLIDADELKKHKYHDNYRFENAVAVAQIDWAETIIEAERSEKE